MSRVHNARHRADGPVKTPLSLISESMPESLSMVGKRAVVVAISSGIALGVSVTPAHALPVTQVQGSALTGVAASSLQSITVSKDEQVTYTASGLKAEAPKVKAETIQRATSTSRSQTRSGASTVSPQSAPAPAPAAAPAAPQSKSGAAALAVAKRYLGVPYVYGGASPAGFDCSGLVTYVYRQFGVNLPRGAIAMRSSGTRVSAAQARPGDLVVFTSHGHVGIYAGNGMMIDAPRPGKVVQLRKIYSSAVVYQRVL